MCLTLPCVDFVLADIFFFIKLRNYVKNFKVLFLDLRKKINTGKDLNIFYFFIFNELKRVD